MLASLGLGSPALGKQTSGPPLGRYALDGITPTLVLDFAAGYASVPWSVSRASVGSYSENGVISEAAPDVPRYVTVDGARMLLLEGASTRLLGGAAPLAAQSAAVTAQTYTLSFYGTGSVVLSGVASGTVAGLGTTTRRTFEFTPAAGTLTVTPTGEVTYLQLEAGSGATSYIPGGNGVATRAPDIPAVLDVSAMSLASGYTCVAWASVEAVASNYDPVLILDNGDNGNRHSIYWDRPASRLSAAIYAGGGSSQGLYSPGAVPALRQPFKIAFSAGPNYFVGASDGGAGSEDPTVTFVPPQYLRLAANVYSARPARLLLSRVVFYPAMMSDGQLGRLTT